MNKEQMIEKIMNDLFGEEKDSSESFCLIPNLVRAKLNKHLQDLESLKEEKKEVDYSEIKNIEDIM